jgi:hypothetical protein
MAVDEITVFDYRQRAPIQIECVDDPLLRVADASRLSDWMAH